MAESNSENPRRLTDWVILVFVLVVMGLLIADLGTNVIETSGQDRRPAAGSMATAGSRPATPTGK